MLGWHNGHPRTVRVDVGVGTSPSGPIHDINGHPESPVPTSTDGTSHKGPPARVVPGPDGTRRGRGPFRVLGPARPDSSQRCRMTLTARYPSGHEPARRDPRAARGRGPVPGRPGRTVEAVAASLRDRPSSTSSSPPAAPRTMPRSMRSTCSAIRHRLSVALGDAVDRLALRRARPISSARWSSGSASRARRRTSSPVIAAARARARRPCHHQRAGVGAGRRGRTDDRPGGRPRAGDRRDQDLHRRAAGDRRAVGGAVRRPGRPRRPLAGIPEALAAALEPRARRSTGSPPTRPPRRALLVLARGYEYATAREWALKLKELAQVFADPYSAADFQHGPLALVEPGVPVLAVRAGPDRADV